MQADGFEEAAWRRSLYTAMYELEMALLDMRRNPGKLDKVDCERADSVIVLERLVAEDMDRMARGKRPAGAWMHYKEFV